MDVSIIIPAYNAENTLKERIVDLKKEIAPEIIVVCNGCTDNTEKLAKSIKNVKVLSFSEKLGKGGAIIKGLDKASCNKIGYIDADNSFQASDLKIMAKTLSDYDCVVSSKWKGSKFTNVKETSIRKLYSRVWNFLVRLLFGLKIKDTQAGMKIFKKRFLPKKFVSKGFEFDVELLYKMKKNGARIYEHGVKIKENKKSTMNKFDNIKMFFGLINIRLFS